MKMALKIMEKEISLPEDIPISVMTCIDVFSVKGYHVYKNVWIPHLQ